MMAVRSLTDGSSMVAGGSEQASSGWACVVVPVMCLDGAEAMQWMVCEVWAKDRWNQSSYS